MPAMAVARSGQPIDLVIGTRMASERRVVFFLADPIDHVELRPRPVAILGFHRHGVERDDGQRGGVRVADIGNRVL